MVFRIFVGVVVASVLMQLIPTGYRRTDPAVIQEPAWDNPRTRELAKRACFNCHSNETIWPWYSRIAPISWLTERDVRAGRSQLNFSEWNKLQPDANDLVNQIQDRRMPLWFYLAIHPESKLTPEETTALIDGLQRSLDGDRK